jgi:hypothetical protein
MRASAVDPVVEPESAVGANSNSFEPGRLGASRPLHEQQPTYGAMSGMPPPLPQQQSMWPPSMTARQPTAQIGMQRPAAQMPRSAFQPQSGMQQQQWAPLQPPSLQPPPPQQQQQQQQQWAPNPQQVEMLLQYAQQQPPPGILPHAWSPPLQAQQQTQQQRPPWTPGAQQAPPSGMHRSPQQQPPPQRGAWAPPPPTTGAWTADEDGDAPSESEEDGHIFMAEHLAGLVGDGGGNDVTPNRATRDFNDVDIDEDIGDMEMDLLSMLTGGDGRPAASSTPSGGAPSAAQRAELGLSNATGQNNCFLNVVVQALFHLPYFSQYFVGLGIGAGTSNPAQRQLFRALQRTFTALSASSESLVANSANGNDMRNALAVAFSEFELGEMNDAAEAMDKVLEALQSIFKEDLVTTKQGRAVVKGRCLVHEVFEWRLSNTAWCAQCSHSQRESMVYESKNEIVYVHILK